MREVKWLWYPYIPFGKLTIIQGDPGEGKTTFALRLAAACSTGRPMPGMESLSPFNVIYQSAEDGLEDTIKPRLTEAGADQERVINIREDKRSLHPPDSRIEKAIMQCDAKLLIQESVAITYPFEEQPDSTRQIHRWRPRCSLYGNFSQEKKAQNQIYLNMKRDRLHCKRSLIIKDLFRQTGIYHIVYFIGVNLIPSISCSSDCGLNPI